MQYRSFGKMEEKVSALGFGMMRLPVLEDESINEELAIKMVRDAIDAGVNYIDTAYPYHQGMSEVLTGKALQDGYREKVYLATKLPIWDVTCPEDFDRLLDEQLEKLQTDHIDFYLFHCLNKQRFDDILVKFNLYEKAEAAKAAGKIRHIGFSFHDDLATFKRIIDGYDKWEFCQIQFNYMNITYQAGLEGLKYAADKGIGVVIMEPLLGGKLANLPEIVKKELPAERSPVENALDFLWNMPEVALLLSGMSTYEQTMENIEYAKRSSVGMLPEEDLAKMAQAKKIYEEIALVPCTKCKYCLPCPAGIEIPNVFDAYNETGYTTMEVAQKLYKNLVVKADACLGCQSCEGQCPQNIKISELMPKIAEVFG